MMPFSPVVIVGSVRSGTNMLRDLVASLPGHATWNCDELPYVWRYGNRSHPTDELAPEQARPEVVRYVRGRFAALARARNARAVVEKTCANSLRVGFVDRVLPEARYLFIVRDGRDAVASAIERWSGSVDLGYTLRKARYAPLRDLPYYGTRFATNRLHKLRSAEGTLKTWGPRFAGIDEMVRTRTLAETCAVQWQRCVEAARAAFDTMPPERVHRLRYEDLVADPERHVKEIAGFLGTSPEAAGEPAAAITARSVGSWRNRLTAEQVEKIEPIVRGALDSMGYAWEPTA